MFNSGAFPPRTLVAAVTRHKYEDPQICSSQKSSLNSLLRPSFQDIIDCTTNTVAPPVPTIRCAELSGLQWLVRASPLTQRNRCRMPQPVHGTRDTRCDANCCHVINSIRLRSGVAAVAVAVAVRLPSARAPKRADSKCSLWRRVACVTAANRRPATSG